MSFLTRNLRVPRLLGNENDKYSDFSIADKNDRKETGLYSWYGVEDNGFWNPKPFEEFRGIEQEDHILPDAEKISNSMKRQSTNAREVDGESRNNPYDRVLLGDPLLGDKLFGEDGSELREYFINDKDISEAYRKNSDYYGPELQDKIDNLVRHVVPSIEEEAWNGEGELGRLILEDQAEMANNFINEEEYRENIGKEITTELISQSRERVLDELLPKLRNSSEIITEDFLREHPLVAYDLLAHSDRLDYVEADIDHAKYVVAHSLETEDRVEAELAELASSEANQIPFNVEWFNDNPEMAELIANDKLTDYENSFGQWLNQQDDYLEGEGFPATLSAEYLTDRANEETENKINSHLFEDSSALSFLTISNSDFSDRLKQNAESINSAFPSGNALSPNLWVLRSYGLGIGENSYGSYQRTI